MDPSTALTLSIAFLNAVAALIAAWAAAKRVAQMERIRHRFEDEEDEPHVGNA